MTIPPGPPAGDDQAPGPEQEDLFGDTGAGPDPDAEDDDDG